MIWFSPLSDRRPLKHRVFLVATLALLLVGPMTMHRYVTFGAGGVFDVEIADGRIRLSTPAATTSEFCVRSGGYDDYSDRSYSDDLLPKAELYGGLHLYMPSWMLMCIAYAFYRRSKRHHDAALKATNWCRSCGSDFATPDAVDCSSCGHDLRLVDRASIIRWIADGVRQDLVFGSAQGNTVFRLTLSVLLYMVFVVCIASWADGSTSVRDCVELLDRTIPSWSLFLTMFTVACLALVMTRIALVMTFIDRPFAETPNPRQSAVV